MGVCLQGMIVKKSLGVFGGVAIAALAFFFTKQIVQRNDFWANNETEATTDNSPEDNELPLCYEVPWIDGQQELPVTPAGNNGEFEWAIPIGFLAGEFEFLPNIMERYQNQLGPLTELTEIVLYAEPGGIDFGKAFLSACNGYTSIGFRLSFYPPHEGTFEVGLYDSIPTGYKFEFINLTYYRRKDGCLNILRNAFPGGFWIKEDDISGSLAPLSFGEYMLEERFRTWRIFGYHQDDLRISPSDDSEVVLSLDESRHVIWDYTGDFTDYWAEVVIYEVTSKNLGGCYANEEVLANWNGNQWTGWLRVFGEGGQFNPDFFISSSQGAGFSENIGVHNSC